MTHDFKQFPELTNNQMQQFYFDSPHKQITEDFEGEVVKITDGDTIHVKWEERVKPIVIRFADNAAPELDEVGGIESALWLKEQIMGEFVQVELTDMRVEKWGRILANVILGGVNICDLSRDTGHSIPWEDRHALWGGY